MSYLEIMRSLSLPPSRSGDTLGGIGSAIALKPGAFKASSDGSFSGMSLIHVLFMVV